MIKEKATFLSTGQPFFAATSAYPDGAWHQYGILFFDAGSADGKLVWYQLENFDPACGDDSLACDWNHPHHFVDTYGRAPYLGDDFEQIEAKSFWNKMLKDGYAEINPPFDGVYLCQDDENNPHKPSLYYLHDDTGASCGISNFEDFCYTIADIDSFLTK